MAQLAGCSACDSGTSQHFATCARLERPWGGATALGLRSMALRHVRDSEGSGTRRRAAQPIPEAELRRDVRLPGRRRLELHPQVPDRHPQQCRGLAAKALAAGSLAEVSGLAAAAPDPIGDATT